MVTVREFRGYPPPKPARFGNITAPIEAAAAEVIPGAGKGISTSIYKLLSHPSIAKYINRGVGRFNLSMEDWAARYLTMFGLYIPQGLFALWENKHKWETNGRNIVIWTLTMLLTIMVKNDRLSVNSLLDVFMRDKNAASGKAKGMFDSLKDKLKLDGNYFDVLEKVGIDFCKIEDVKKAYWANLDSNQVEKIVKFYDGLLEKAKGGALEAGESKMMTLIPKFLMRRNFFNLAQTGIITLLTMYVIGSFAMELVFRFIAPFDHDFDPAKFQKSRQKPNRPTAAPVQHPPIALDPAHPFRAFQLASAAGRNQGAGR